MQKSIDEVREHLANDRVGEALQLINLIMSEAMSEELFYLRGKIHLRLNEWKLATDDFLKAQELNPDGPATQQLSMINSIMDFYNKDMYNH